MPVVIDPPHSNSGLSPSRPIPRSLLYAIAARGNSLYEGRYRLGRRYQTYGQQSFVFDLATTAARLGIQLTLAIDGIDEFPLTEPIARYCKVVDLRSMLKYPEVEAEVILVDELPDELLAMLPETVPKLCVVHNAASRYSELTRDVCERFICMTETSVVFQSKHIDPDRLILIHQGVDTQRFRPRPGQPSVETNALVYTRLNREKAPTILAVLDQLLSAGVPTTVLGDGELFWEISDKWGEGLLLVQHVPCLSLPRFLPRFSHAISSGRGVMEALACGIPTICAGLGYAGLVTSENIGHLLRANLTGFGEGRSVTSLQLDLDAARMTTPGDNRRAALDHCSMDRFLHELLAAIETPDRGHQRRTT